MTLTIPSKLFNYLSMNERTFDRRYNQLVTLLNIHPNKEELIYIMQQQIDDDIVRLDTST
ncbi:hypothetical protein [uncultured phage MedDCM-OCT-S05-C243]|uniref:Uncharacterized protein n=1 Tax=uncultured phage MedDCM-OCT-S05-C243 TaxID=743558 RepID=D6PI06_9CAUD|nr:hypothetical protein HOT86_gp13 [uncultured phage MedDCM-OCT-S05-C243]ADD95357.1 hypothetical protein [uncultured phage MedDCM-OCT-S05-C243]